MIKGVQGYYLVYLVVSRLNNFDFVEPLNQKNGLNAILKIVLHCFLCYGIFELGREKM